MDDQVALGEFATVFGTICAAIAVLAAIRMRIDEWAARREEDDRCDT